MTDEPVEKIRRAHLADTKLDAEGVRLSADRGWVTRWGFIRTSAEESG